MQESAVPPTPPTPPVSLAALLSREDLALRQLAGPPAAEVTVHWAHTSEMSDPFPYLLGGELLLTAGVHIPDRAESGTYFDDYVSRIAAAGGAALGFGVAPVHDTVPRALVAACEAYGLPLVEVPPRTTFSGVARAVWQLMAQARLAELRRVSEAQQGLAAAASRPDPVPSVLRRLATRLDGRAVLYGPDGAEIAAAGREPGDEVRRALAELARYVTGHASSTATDTVAGTRLAAYALGTGQGFVLGVAAPHRESGDHTIASVAAVLLSLLTGEHQSGTGAARSSALVRLLLGARPEEVAPLLGADADGGGGVAARWYVVHARPTTGPPDPVSASALGTALGSPLVDTAGDVVRVLVPAAPHADAGEGSGAGTGAETGLTAKTGAGEGPGAGTGAEAGPEAGPVAEAGAGAKTGAEAGPGAGTGAGEGSGTGAEAGPRAGTGAGAGPDPEVRPGAGPAPAIAPGAEANASAVIAGATASPGAGALARPGTGPRADQVAAADSRGFAGPASTAGPHRPAGPASTTDPHRPAEPASTARPHRPAAPASSIGPHRPAKPEDPGDSGPVAQPGWILGVSAPVAPVEWPAADAQAGRALARARATRVPLVRHGTRPALADLVPDGEAEAHARALLAPVAAVPALTETLRAWLSLHGSWDRTAVALSVHRNTVRQRIARCAALLDVDLDDPDVRMELWFALRR